MQLGAVVAIDWAVFDWEWPVLASGKQGQDVKALALISPEWNFKSLHIAEAVNQPSFRNELSVLIIVGKGNAKLLSEAKRLDNGLERFHPVPSTPAEAAEKQMIWLKTPETSLQGTRLLHEKSLHVDRMILQFIDRRLGKQPYVWSERRDPHK